MAITLYTSDQPISRNFRSAEFACCQKPWPIDSRLVDFLQQIRDHFGKPLHISSGYRCPEHNAQAGSTDKSYHTKGMAADIWIEEYLYQPKIIAQYAESIGVPGIGLYEGSRDMWFVHIDTRPQKIFWYSHQEIIVPSFLDTQIQLSLRVLQQGHLGSDVTALQQLLNANGHACQIDGSFGPATKKALLAYQQAQGLAIDGSCGPLTWNRILGRA